MIIASSILNILLLLVIVYLVWAIGEAKGFSQICHEQWSKWEQRYWKVVCLVNDKTDYTLRIDGIESELRLEKKGVSE